MLSTFGQINIICSLEKLIWLFQALSCVIIRNQFCLHEFPNHYVNRRSTPIKVEGVKKTIDVQTVRIAISRFKNGKATSPVGIPAELIQNCTEQLLRLLIKIMNVYLRVLLFLNNERNISSYIKTYINNIFCLK